VVRIDIEWCASREAALWAESAAIKNENPKHNIMRPGKYGIAARSPELKAKHDKIIAEGAALGIRLDRNACLERLQQMLEWGKSDLAKSSQNLPS
jgi:hypothetical protein